MGAKERQINIGTGGPAHTYAISYGLYCSSKKQSVCVTSKLKACDYQEVYLFAALC